MPEIHFGQLLVGVPTLERFNALSTMIEELGYETIEVDTSEFRKLDGGLSCLSLRF